MKNLLCLVLFLPLTLSAQRKLQYGLAVNQGLEKIYPEDRTLDVARTPIIGYYLSAGLHSNIDSVFIFYCGLRYGRENSRFRIKPDATNSHYRTRNTSLCFILAPGIRLNKRQSLFLNLVVARVLQANHGGSGSGIRNGKAYSFEYVDNLPQNSWEFRPGFKWQYRPVLQKKFAVELGVEPSLLTRNIDIKLRNANPNSQAPVYRVRYDIVFFYTGFVF